MSVVVRPKMLGITAGMNQKDCHEVTLVLRCPCHAGRAGAGFSGSGCETVVLQQLRLVEKIVVDMPVVPPPVLCGTVRRKMWIFRRGSAVALGQGRWCPCLESSTGAGSWDPTVASR